MPGRLPVSHYSVRCGGAQTSYNDLIPFPQAMGDSLQLSLRPSREYAAHRVCPASCYRCHIVSCRSTQRRRAVERQVMFCVVVGVLEFGDTRQLVFKLTRTGPTRVVTPSSCMNETSSRAKRECEMHSCSDVRSWTTIVSLRRGLRDGASLSMPWTSQPSLQPLHSPPYPSTPQ